MAAPEGDSPAQTEGKPKGKKQRKRVKWGKDQVKEFGSNDEYQPVEVPATDELLAVYKICLAQADSTFTVGLCRNPLPMLAAVIGVLTATEANPTIPDVSKTKVTEAIRYMAERLATLQVLVDPSTPAINAA